MLETARVLFPFAAETRGGSVMSAFTTMRELKRRGFEVVVATHGTDFVDALAEEAGFRTIRLPALGAKSENNRSDAFRLGNFGAIPAAFRCIGEVKPDIVHVNDKRMVRTWAFPALVRRVPMLVHWRSVYWRSVSVDLGLRSAKRIIAVSKYSLDLLPAWARDKGTTIYNAIIVPELTEDRASVRKRIRAEAGIPQEAVLLGFFGSLVDRKRAHVVADILDKLHTSADGRPYWAAICGLHTAPNDGKLEASLSKSDVRERIVLPGFVRNANEWMAACDLFVAPGVDEPLARSGVEALRLGVPPLVSSDGGLKEAVRDGVSGYVIDPFDEAAWIARVSELADNSTLYNEIAAQGPHSAEMFDLSRHCDLIIGEYEKILA